MVSLILFLVGMGVLGYGLFNVLKASDSQSWPHANGKVLSSRVESRRSSNSNGGSSRTYEAVVSYQYRVKGKVLTGDRISFGEISSSNRSWAEDIAKKYRRGRIVKVFYDPSNPADAVLENGVNWGTWFLPGFGLVFMIISGLSFIMPQGLLKSH